MRGREGVTGGEFERFLVVSPTAWPIFPTIHSTVDLGLNRVERASPSPPCGSDGTRTSSTSRSKPQGLPNRPQLCRSRTERRSVVTVSAMARQTPEDLVSWIARLHGPELVARVSTGVRAESLIAGETDARQVRLQHIQTYIEHWVSLSWVFL